jgi:hypothetical protein
VHEGLTGSLLQRARDRKARNPAANPACTISVRLEGVDLVLEGEAARVTDPPTLELVAGRYREGGWRRELAPDGSPTAIPP